ncbi:TIGR04104 family putative zinc finger protein [Paucisalibacillus sp. EB02]|uniref:TIGR04104 family putative zinc finger protein n=1 Tax=Paucisalibacillus sp. EB02 TaxID=1347087 RepID=UPI0005A6A7C0|nr:TIGR04104 family putative zinc finger protein [Paucisalibacillus sp. EB02]
MQKCENCNAQFSWNKIYKSFWWNYKPIKCDDCGAKHKITIPGRFVFVSLTILPMLIFGNFLSQFSNILVTLGIALLIFFVGSLLTPFFVTYKDSCE